MSYYRRWIHKKERLLTLRDTNRRVLPFEWGLEWLGLAANGGADPLGRLQQYADKALQESDTYFTPPPLSDYCLNGDRLSFPSPTPGQDLFNNTAYCRLFPAPDSSKAVVVVPQWNCDPGSHVGLCRILQRLGFTVARLCLPYHEERRPPGMERADYMVSPNIGRTLYATRQGVLEVRRLVEWLRSRGHSQIAVMGTSLGSCVAYLAFTHDPSIATGVFNHVSAFFADVVWFGLSTRFVRWGLEGRIEPRALRRCWAPISPYHFVRRLKKRPRPHLLISAKYDLTFLPELTEKVFDQYRAHQIPCDRALLPCGHYTTARFPFKHLDGWHICRYLRSQLRG
ncbi:MAG: RcgR family putative quorum lactone hydrolase [Acidobacteriota bacterium]